jgi:hypothetical protein
VGNKITPCHPRRMTWHSKMMWSMTWLSLGTPSDPVGHPVWPYLAPVRPSVWPHLALFSPRLAPRLPPCLAPVGGLDGGDRRGARRGQTEGQTENQTRPDEGPDGARRGARRKDYLLLKEKTTCFVYVSCKSSSALDVSDARWL